MALQTAGRDNVAALIGNVGTPYNYTYIGIGDSAAAINAAHTDLQGTTKYRTAASNSEASQTLTATKTNWQPGAMVVRECGLFQQAAGGGMLCRSLVSPEVTLTAADYINMTITVAVS